MPLFFLDGNKLEGLQDHVLGHALNEETRIAFSRFLHAARHGTESSLKIGATVGSIGSIIRAWAGSSPYDSV